MEILLRIHKVLFDANLYQPKDYNYSHVYSTEESRMGEATSC